MAINVMNRVWAHSRAKNSARLVLLAIADCCRNDDGTGAWPSMTVLVKKTNLSLRAVQSAIRELENLGELKVERNAGSAGQNVYAVLIWDVTGATPPQILHPADSAPPQNLHPANPAPPADSARTPANPARRGAESAPGTIKNHQEPGPYPRARNGRTPKHQQARAAPLGDALLAEHLAICPVAPPRNLQRRTGEAINGLLNEGIDPERIRAGLALMRSRPRTGPGLLPDLVHEAATLATLRPTGTDSRYMPGSGSQVPDRDDYDPENFI